MTRVIPDRGKASAGSVFHHAEPKIGNVQKLCRRFLAVGVCGHLPAQSRLRSIMLLGFVTHCLHPSDTLPTQLRGRRGSVPPLRHQLAEFLRVCPKCGAVGKVGDGNERRTWLRLKQLGSSSGSRFAFR